MDINKPFTVKDFERERKISQFKESVKNAAKTAYDWAVENPMISVPMIGAAVGKGVKTLIRAANHRKEQNLKDRYIYDRSLGMYLELKRKLTNKDYAFINKRRKNGEKLSDILQSMRVLK